MTTLSPKVQKLLSTSTNLRGVWLGQIDYEQALVMQRAAVEQRLVNTISDCVYYLEHPPVITYGRATPPQHLPDKSLGIELREVSRGGQATYHGPGQLVGYLIVDLKSRKPGLPPDLHSFLRAIEEGISDYLSTKWSLRAGSVPGKTGVWVFDHVTARKIASIGIAVRRWVSYHGFALNINPDLSIFSKFVPCGLSGDVMTSLAVEVGERWGRQKRQPTLEQIAEELHSHLAEALIRYGWCTRNNDE